MLSSTFFVIYTNYYCIQIFLWDIYFNFVCYSSSSSQKFYFQWFIRDFRNILDFNISGSFIRMSVILNLLVLLRQL